MGPSFLLFLLSLLSSLAIGSCEPTISLIYGEQMRVNLQKSNISLIDFGRGEGGREILNYELVIHVESDNKNDSLPLSYRRWWHFLLEGLENPNGCKISATLENAQYSDIILPVWSLDGATYERLDQASIPRYDGTNHYFTITVPPGVTSFRLAKYFPFALTSLQTLREEVLKSPLLTETQIGKSGDGIPLYSWEVSLPETMAKEGAPRILIQVGAHPAETTSYYVLEGFLSWLLFSSSEKAKTLLSLSVINLLPMVNPDGVALGNYRTTSESVNLETEFYSPYKTTIPESQAIIQLIERFMGTSTVPGSHPLLVLINLHSTHDEKYPCHFIHEPFYLVNKTGVIPEVNALEKLWVNLFKQTSPFVNKGSSLSSTFGTRSYIESMVHDRWSIDESYPAPLTMAITFEGIYQYNKDGSCCNEKEDYQKVGEEMGEALLLYVLEALEGKAQKRGNY